MMMQAGVKQGGELLINQWCVHPRVAAELLRPGPFP
jgi:hypothetical protein